MAWSAKADEVRQRLLRPTAFRFYLWKMLPLAAFAGLKLRSLDEKECSVALPGGWRTQNPFRSAYFAAQAMAAEMSTGAPAMVLAAGAPASVSILVREIRAVFTKKVVGESVFTFTDIGAMAGAIERAAATGESEGFVARSIGRMADGTVGAEFEVTWSFKRRG